MQIDLDKLQIVSEKPKRSESSRCEHNFKLGTAR